jgi:hypothetical protein
MLANLMMILVAWTLGSVVLGLIVGRVIAFHVAPAPQARRKKVA